jgi:16S rRNA (cytosine967-C5)-methyltransferase
MANALLRQVADAIVQRRCPWQRLDPSQVRVDWDQACQFGVNVLPEPTDARAEAYLAAATGERLTRHRTLVERYGLDTAESVGWAAQAVPVTVLQRNALRCSEGDFRAALERACGEAVEFAENAAFVAADQPIVDVPVFREGGAYVQDVTQRAATLALAARPGERVLDLCAAPGGKSIALALALRDEGVVYACDASRERLARVDENTRRLRLRCIEPRVLAEHEAPDARMQGLDAALVDVPCSNTGVIARRPEARLGLSVTKLRSLVRLQAGLLEKAAACVRPGGRLVYCTCSIEPEENEQVVAAFLAQRPAWRLDVQRLALPKWGPWRSDWRDGGYFARLLRSG